MACWTWRELETMWQHPDLTARELSEIIQHTPQAIEKQRYRMGRWKMAPLCCVCGERPVWVESPRSKRLGLCKGCYLDEERLRLEEDVESAAVRQQRSRKRWTT